tara:strand:+ start:1326 stop:1667 length:342 start_codon:yes stop_codon:yes gene_type:complete
MSEDKIIPMDKKTESDPTLEQKNQEKIAGELGQKICDLIGDYIENKGFHPLTATLLVADIAAMYCVHGGNAGIAVLSEALGSKCREMAGKEVEAHKAMEAMEETKPKEEESKE